jgi:hypothetical protein
MEKTIHPQEIFKNNTNRLFERFSDAKILQNALDTYKSKSFLEEYKSLSLFFQYGSFILQALAAYFGYSFFYDIMIDLAPKIPYRTHAAILSSIVILFMLEYCKRFFFQKFMKSVPVKPNFWLLGINIALISFAAYTSVNGAIDHSRKQTDRSENIKEDAKKEKARVDKSYASEIADAKAEKEAYRKSVMWHGAINTSDKKIMVQLAQYDDRIKDLERDRQKEKSNIEKDKEGDLTSNSTKTQKGTFKMAGISFAVETIGLLMIGFCEWYKARVKIEHELNGYVASDPTDALLKGFEIIAAKFAPASNYDPLLQGINSLVAAMHHTATPIKHVTPITTIGFHTPKGGVTGGCDRGVTPSNDDFLIKKHLGGVTDVIKYEQNKRYLLLHIDIVQLVDAVIEGREKLSNSDIIDMTGKSLTTINNVKRVMGVTFKTATAI